MYLYIRNWKLALLSLLLLALFIFLGCWQLSRAWQKEVLLREFALRIKHPPLSASALVTANDERFYRVILTGTFDNIHTFLLDNKIYEGRVGYEIYTPFSTTDLATTILVDRGFVPAPSDRHILPTIEPIVGTTTITGMLNLPPTYVQWGNLYESPLHWPLRIEYLDISQLSNLLSTHIYQYVLQITPNTPPAYDMQWQINVIGPERHRGYALQWFAFAITLLILFAALNCGTKKTS
jgi:surfeit locus 1 family protein